MIRLEWQSEALIILFFFLSFCHFKSIDFSLLLCFQVQPMSVITNACRCPRNREKEVYLLISKHELVFLFKGVEREKKLTGRIDLPFVCLQSRNEMKIEKEMGKKDRVRLNALLSTPVNQLDQESDSPLSSQTNRLSRRDTMICHPSLSLFLLSLAW